MKRHTAFQPISREHRDVLAFCLHVDKMQFIDTVDLTIYCHQFWNEFLQPHFIFEEQHIFTIPQVPHHLVQEAEKQHITIKNIFEKPNISITDISVLANTLRHHIRWEERTFFPELEKLLTLELINKLESNYTIKHFCSLPPTK